MTSGLGVLSAGVGSKEEAVKHPWKGSRHPVDGIPKPHWLHKVRKQIKKCECHPIKMVTSRLAELFEWARILSKQPIAAPIGISSATYKWGIGLDSVKRVE